MENSFSGRLERVLQHYQMTSSELAQKLGVQKSSISHLLSGRNKPSYDFLSKFTLQFPEINLRWLLTGQGEMLSPTLSASKDKPEQTYNSKKETKPSRPVQLTIPFFESPVEIIKVFSDGTFEILRKKNQ